MEGTVRDFWEMVWQERSPCIIMLCKFWEEGKEKCTVYFPEFLKEVVGVGGKMDVECMGLKRECGGRIEVRELLLIRKGKERRVWHFLYNAWPDQGIPTSGKDRKALLHLAKRSRSHSRTRGHSKSVVGPRIVHCSAGVGRTGTFIALDYLFHFLGEKKWDSNLRIDPVADTVRRLREQRMKMVHREGQFMFLYQMLRDEWEARNVGSREQTKQRSSRRKRRRHDDQGNKGKKGTDSVGFLRSLKLWLAAKLQHRKT
jgi:protein-tyrosine phosphatase